MSSKIGMLKRKAKREARRVREINDLLCREVSYDLLPEGELLRAFHAAFPNCSPLLLPYEEGHRGVVCINCGNCLVREPEGGLFEDVLDLDEFFGEKVGGSVQM